MFEVAEIVRQGHPYVVTLPSFLDFKVLQTERVSKYQRILFEAMGTVVSTAVQKIPLVFLAGHILCSSSTPYLEIHKVPGTFCVHEIHLTYRDPQSPVHILFMQYSLPAGVPQSPGHILCSCGTPYLESSTKSRAHSLFMFHTAPSPTSGRTEPRPYRIQSVFALCTSPAGVPQSLWRTPGRRRQ